MKITRERAFASAFQSLNYSANKAPGALNRPRNRHFPTATRLPEPQTPLHHGRK